MTQKINITGTGFLALDIILNGSKSTPPKIHAGGSFGNVLTILSYLGFQTYPISRLADNKVSDLLIEDITRYGVHTDFITRQDKGSTPIIIHRILKDKEGNPKHKFEFRNPINGNWLPGYRPFLAREVKLIEDRIPQSMVFYFDRVSRSSIELAQVAKQNGAIIYFEPTSFNESKQFQESLKVADIIKYSKDQISNYKTLFPKQNAVLEIETNGSKGINYRFKSDEWKTLKPFFVKDVVDAAGAGDWCSSGIIEVICLNGELTGQSSNQIEEALNYGQALGAINCLYDGARGAMYNMDVDKLKEVTTELMQNSLNSKDIVSKKIVNNLTYLDVERLFSSV